MKLFATKFGALSLGGPLLTCLAVVLLATGAGAVRREPSTLAIAMIALFTLLLLSHGFSVKTATRTREVQQGDTRHLPQGIDRASEDAVAVRSVVSELATGFDAAGMRETVASGTGKLAEDSKAAAREHLLKATRGNGVGNIDGYFGASIGAEFGYAGRARKASGHFEEIMERYSAAALDKRLVALVDGGKTRLPECEAE